ncbi:hypothetical protein DIPPA_04875 [Diplonema papillatum]|nr:hypothetical protein DIPPA_04875 [Diplonema papillatum]
MEKKGDGGEVLSKDDETFFEPLKDTLITHILSEVVSGSLRAQDVTAEVCRVEKEASFLPDVVILERFIENLRALEPSLGASVDSPGMLSLLEDRLQALLQRNAASYSATSETSTDYSSSDNEDPDNSPPLDVWLNPQLRISQPEYRAWLCFCQSLQNTNSLCIGDAPRRLLLLMSKSFSSGIALEASCALKQLYFEFQDDWFDKETYGHLRRIVRRGLVATGVCVYRRRERIKQRRKVFKARKRLWENEVRLRVALEEEFGESMEDYRTEFVDPVRRMKLSCMSNPTWFTTLLQEHYALLEEQLGRSLLEREYADLVSNLIHSSSVPGAVS